MNASLFWFTDEQWARIEPHLPNNQRGPERKDDRRILSGIIHVQRSGCRWKDCPSEYGPAKTIYNRFARWSERGIWQRMFAAVAGEPDAPGHVVLDSLRTVDRDARCTEQIKLAAQRHRPLHRVLLVT
jgi:mannitol 2-dehydrogenase